MWISVTDPVFEPVGCSLVNHRCVAVRSSANLFAANLVVGPVTATPALFSGAAVAATRIDRCNLKPKIARLEVNRFVLALAVRQLRKPLS
jgi:hypothetical protein